MKKVLVLHYSQTGQLTEILKSLVSMMDNSKIKLEFKSIIPSTPYPFPWNKEAFFDKMPDSVLGNTHDIEPIVTDEEKYDLVILGYQVWFLNPSIPFNSFLESEYAKRILKDTPIVTVLGVRNMWVMAQEKVKLKLRDLGANLVGNIVYVDKNPNLISVITIQHWLFGGKKTKFLKIFPLPGIDQKEINSAFKFGEKIQECLLADDCNNLQDILVKQKAVKVVDTTVFIEKRGSMLFRLWAKLIERKSTSPKKRKFWLKVYNIYLLFALFIVSPVVILLYTISKVFRLKQIRNEINYYQGVKL